MAVATQMELWRGLQVNDKVKKKGNGWGEDRQKVLQLMLGQFNNRTSPTTLDLLGNTIKPSSSTTHESADLLELDQEQCLPAGWEKCLDLKTGAVYYVNSVTGNRTSIETLNVPKHAETIRSISGSQKSQKNGSDSHLACDHEGRLELKLNLTASKDLSLHTINAEDDGQAVAKRSCLGKRDSNAISESSNISSMISPSASSSYSSPSSCVSSEVTERSSTGSCNTGTESLKNNGHTTESTSAPTMVLVGCPRCLMYVMLSRADPKCPKCKSSVLLDFPHPESSKRPRTV